MKLATRLSKTFFSRSLKAGVALGLAAALPWFAKEEASLRSEPVEVSPQEKLSAFIEEAGRIEKNLGNVNRVDDR